MINATVMTITPEISKSWLKLNEKNFRRDKISKTKISQYAQDMKNGKWELNAEAIVFDEDGFLKDGQHRLLAVIEAGVAVQMLVVTGVSRSVSLWDIGWTRSITQNLNLKCKYKSTVASIALLIISDFYDEIYTQRQILDYIEKHQDMLIDAAYLACLSNSIIRQSSVALAAYIKLRSGIQYDTLQQFFKVASTGYQIDGYDCTSAIAFRNTIIAAKRINTPLARKRICARALHAIDDFLNHRHRTKIYSDDPGRILEFDILRGMDLKD